MKLIETLKKYRYLLLSLIVPLIFYLSGILTLSDYGINWDEPYHYRRGQAYLHFFLTGQKTYEGMPKYPPLKGNSDSFDFRDSEKNFKAVQDNPSLSDPNFRRSYYQDDSWNGEYFIDTEDPYGHPALPSILASISNLIFYQKLNLLGEIEAYHLFQVTVTALTVAFIAVFMYKRFNLFTSIVASLAISTYPLLLGERHFNIKDPIEMSFYTLTILAFYLSVIKNSKIWLLSSVFFAALALSTKFNIIFSMFPLGIWVLYLSITKEIKFSALIKNFYPVILSAPIIIFGLVILSFPSLWKNPAGGLMRMFLYYKEVGFDASQPVSYYFINGNFNSFPFLWILFTTPLITLFLAISNIFFAKKLFSKKDMAFGLLMLLWVLIVILRISLFGSLSYGGVRIIMEFIPPLAILASIGAYHLGNKFGSTIKYIIILSFIPIIYVLYSIHPQENTYFNHLIGGLKGAKEANFNSWGNSNGNAYYEGILWINKNAETNALLTVPVGSTSNIPRFKLRPDIAVSRNYWSGPENSGEYVIELTYDYKPMQWFNLKYLNEALTPVYEVKADGVTLAAVWKNDKKFLKEPFRQQTSIISPVKLLNASTLEIIKLDSPKKIMRIDINVPTSNCQPINTGYIESSVDGYAWTREEEDVARNQLKHQAKRGLEPVFSYYFVAREANTLRIHVDNTNACVLKANSAKITFLEEI